MPKTIWVKDEVYRELDSLRLGRETFGDIIMRLIRVFRAAQALPGISIKTREEKGKFPR